MKTMLTTSEASRAIADAMPAIGTVTVSLGESVGRILRQSITAERDQPPFDRVTMDGIAVRFESLAGGNQSFAIEATQHAGDAVLSLHGDDNCIEIMTGAVLPQGTDCVIPVERITVDDKVAIVEDDYRAERHQYVHPQGSDYVQGVEVLKSGLRITPMDIAIIASCGLEQVRVSSLPTVRVISTGNELVPPGQALKPHQIRLSNGPAVVAMLSQQGFHDAAHEHLIDEPKLLEARLSSLLSEGDVLLLSGGVSMGKADFVPRVLANLGVQPIFHKISQRPGKPMWFGMGPAGQAVFALPGNPVSTLVCCRHYVLPALLEASGREAIVLETARLAEDFDFEADLTCFLPVRLLHDAQGVVKATPTPTNTSGDFSSLSGTDGYVELAREQSEFPAGTVVPLHRWALP